MGQAAGPRADGFAPATIGVIVSAFLVAAICWLAAQALNLPIGFAWCLAFGALIAPTDAVAAIAALKSVDLPEALETEISGEALFNDGVSIVLFTVALQFAMTGPQNPQPTDIAIALVQQTAGGLRCLSCNGVSRLSRDQDGQRLFRRSSVFSRSGDGHLRLAETLNVSGPIAVVIAGIFIGNRGAPLVMSKETRSYFFGFWRLVDYMLNASCLPFWDWKCSS